MGSIQWDVVAISAMDGAQKSAFEKQLVQLRQSSEHVSEAAIHFRVYADEPEGVKIGGGGATLSIVHRLHREFGPRLFEFRILLIHAGGYSQRQPNASILGKLFIATPVESESDHGRPLSLLELKLRTYEPLLRRMNPGIFLAASDTLEYLGDFNRLTDGNTDWSLDGSGFVALAHPSTLEIGKQHGVYVLDDQNAVVNMDKQPDVFESQCRRVLQKPTFDVMRQQGAVSINGKQEIVYTDSAFYMSSAVVKKLLDIYDRLSPLACELDCYGDFLQPLGSEATDDYLAAPAVNALVQNEGLSAARRYLFDSFRGLPLKVVVFAKSRFYHLGTFKELLDHFCGVDGSFHTDFGTSGIVYSSIPSAKSISPNACILNSLIDGPIICNGSARILMEFCRLRVGFEFTIDGGECVLSNCVSKNSLVRISASVFMMTAPIDDSSAIKYVTVMLGMKDDLKSTIEDDYIDSTANTGGRFSAIQLMRSEFIKKDSVFENSSHRSLWYARLFPSFDSMEESFEWTLQWLNSISDRSSMDQIAAACDGRKFYSMHDLVAAKSVDSLLSYRQSLNDQIRVDLMKFGKL